MKSKFTKLLRNKYFYLFLVAFIPNLIVSIGTIAADNKLYLFVDPGRFFIQSAQIWDPTNALGTVTFQHVGYLLPLDPFFYIFEHLYVPVWVVERLWTGCLLFFAGAGVSWFLDKMRFSTTTSAVAGFFYMLSPYSLQYLYRISDILLPWSALGWLMGLMYLSTLTNGWKYVSIFSLVVAVIGGTNGSSLIFVGIGPVCLLLYLWKVKRLISNRDCLKIFLKLAVLCTLVSVWWFTALEIEAKYGLNILKYTETVQAVSSTSLASEVLRGLGYWFYYGQNTIGPWAPSSVGYMEHIWLIFISFLIPTLSILGAVVVRFKNRGFFILLLAIGLIVSVGTHPFGSQAPWSKFITWFMLYTTPGFALRSTDRAAPLVIMCLAVFFGLGVEVLVAKIKAGKLRIRLLRNYKAVYVITGLLLLLNNPAIFDGQLLSPQYSRPSTIPTYDYQAANYLNKQPSDTRVLVEPGTDTSVYRWGTTGDPLLPALTTRQTAEREQLPHGTLPSLDLMTAIDQPFQEETMNPATLAPIARLISAGDILLQNDLAYEDYNLPNPRQLWSQFNPTPNGLSKPVSFGKPVLNIPPKSEKLTYGEQSLAQSSNLPIPPPVAIFNVKNARPLIRTESTNNPIIVDGGGTGLVNAGAMGLLNTNAPVFYSGSFTNNSKNRQLLKNISQNNAALVLTDTNRKESRRWDGTIQDVNGYTETATQTNNPQDYSDAPIDLFPNSPGSQTVTVLNGIAAVNASVYGNQVTYEPYERPFLALDKNPNTAWSYSSFVYGPPQWWEVTLINPITTNYISVSQVLTGSPIAKISKITLNFNNGYSQNYTLNSSSRTSIGQKLTFPSQTFTKLTITIDSTAPTGAKTGTDEVGFSEVNIPSIQAQEVVATPTDMLSTLGPSSINNRLSILLNRQIVGPFPPRGNPENTITRQIYLPSERQFSITGLAALSLNAPDDIIDTILGVTPVNGNGYVANSSGRLPGLLSARAYSAFDNNSQTSWSPGSGYSQQIGSWVEIDTPNSVTFNTIDLKVNADRYHSVPTQVTLSTQSGIRILKLPTIKSKGPKNRTVTIPLRFPSLTGNRIRLTIDAINPFYGRDVPNQPFYTLPVGIAEVGIPNVTMPKLPSTFPNTCFNNLITVNGISVPIRLIGSTASALSGNPIPYIECNPSQNEITMFSGDNIVQTQQGNQTGIDINSIGLDSKPGGSPNPILVPGQLQNPQSDHPVANIKVTGSTAVSFNAKLTTYGKPFWLVLGQSQDQGWSLNLNGKPVSKGSTLIDGYANGWLIAPSKGVHTYNISFRFDPQSWLNYSYILFILTLLVTLFLVIFGKGIKKSELINLTGPVVAHLNSEIFSIKMLKTERLPFFQLLFILISISATSFIFMPYMYGLYSFLITTLCLLAIRNYRILALTSVISIASIVMYMSIAQLIYQTVPGDGWPSSYELSNYLAWYGIISLVGYFIFEIYYSKRSHFKRDRVSAYHLSVNPTLNNQHK